MKTCPVCAETDLQDAARVCKHCSHKFTMPNTPRQKFAGRIGLVVIAYPLLYLTYHLGLILYLSGVAQFLKPIFHLQPYLVEEVLLLVAATLFYRMQQ